MGFVELTDVAFSYDGERDALAGVSLSIELGEFVCVVGGNGSGKSTLAKHLNGLLIPDSGRVLVDGADTGEKGGAFRARQLVGMVFQSPDDALVTTIVEDDVAFGPQNLGLSRDEIAARVSQSLAEVGLAGYERASTVALSGGQKQRVAIAGVLAMKPRVLVMDEATAMLDPSGKAEILAVAQRLHAQGMTIVWVTHTMEELAAATRVVAMHAGQVAFDGPADTLLRQPDLLETLKLRMPYSAQLVSELERRGMCIDASPLASPAQLAEALLPASSPGR